MKQTVALLQGFYAISARAHAKSDRSHLEDKWSAQAASIPVHGCRIPRRGGTDSPKKITV
jgi:hypothetical protein